MKNSFLVAKMVMGTYYVFPRRTKYNVVTYSEESHVMIMNQVNGLASFISLVLALASSSGLKKKSEVYFVNVF